MSLCLHAPLEGGEFLLCMFGFLLPRVCSSICGRDSDFFPSSSIRQVPQIHLSIGQNKSPLPTLMFQKII
jgi:hypothetical protein